MPRGGARPGAGRKRKTAPATPESAPLVDAQGFKTSAAPANWPFGKEQPAEPAPPADLSELTPQDYLLSVLRNEEEDKARRMTAAQLLLPYMHQKKGEAGKKAEKTEAAKVVGGKFGVRVDRPLAH